LEGRKQQQSRLTRDLLPDGEGSPVYLQAHFPWCQPGCKLAGTCQEAKSEIELIERERERRREGGEETKLIEGGRKRGKERGMKGRWEGKEGRE
jgi:hypothetical protein